MPAFLDEPFEAVWAVCIHPRSFTLNSYLDYDLQTINPAVKQDGRLAVIHWPVCQ